MKISSSNQGSNSNKKFKGSGEKYDKRYNANRSPVNNYNNNQGHNNEFHANSSNKKHLEIGSNSRFSNSNKFK